MRTPPTNYFIESSGQVTYMETHPERVAGISQCIGQVSSHLSKPQCIVLYPVFSYPPALQNNRLNRKSGATEITKAKTTTTTFIHNEVRLKCMKYQLSPYGADILTIQQVNLRQYQNLLSCVHHRSRSH